MPAGFRPHFTWSRARENANLMNKMGDLRRTKTKRDSFVTTDFVGTAKSPQTLTVREKRSKNRGSALKCGTNRLTPLTDSTAFRWLCEPTLIFHRNFARRRCFCDFFIFCEGVFIASKGPICCSVKNRGARRSISGAISVNPRGITMQASKPLNDEE